MAKKLNQNNLTISPSHNNPMQIVHIGLDVPLFTEQYTLGNNACI